MNVDVLVEVPRGYVLNSWDESRLLASFRLESEVCEGRRDDHYGCTWEHLNIVGGVLRGRPRTSTGPREEKYQAGNIVDGSSSGREARCRRA